MLCRLLLIVSLVGLAMVVQASDYMIVDISAGPTAASYPVSYLSAAPAGGWTDEYKTTKMAFRRIPAGTFTMGSPSDELGRSSDETQHQVTFTQPVYFGIFEVTQKQWERVMGTWPSWFQNATFRETRPVERVSFSDIRGSSAGAGWPGNSDVDTDSFMGRLRARTNKPFDLPTESQWEYAGRASTSTALNSGQSITNSETDAHMSEVGRYWYNGGYGGYGNPNADTSTGSAKVGSYQPNAWGLYDIHGNVWEWCLDWYGSYPGTVTDPKGAPSGSGHLGRGGSWGNNVQNCRVGNREDNPAYYASTAGFRVVLPTELTLDDGLVAFYPFNGNANDESGHGNSGALSGVTLTSDRFAKPNSAYSFNGVSSFIQVPDSNSLDLSTTFTLSAWVLLQRSADGDGGVLSKQRPNSGGGFALSVNSSDHGFMGMNNDHDSIYGHNLGVASSNTIPQGSWHYLVGVCDGSNVDVYVDGVKTGHGYWPWGTLLNSTYPLYIGRNLTSDYDVYFGGSIDDIRIYNRALSVSEIMQLYTMAGDGGTNGQPQTTALSNVRASQTGDAKLVEGYYDISGAFSTIPVAVMISTNGGTSYNINGPSYSAVAPGNNRSFSWDMSTAFNNKQCSQMRIKVVAGSAVAESAVFAVDTRDTGNRPIVQDVTSPYCDNHRHVYFLNGVSLTAAFTANLNWNGKTPGTIKFVTPVGTYSGAQTQRSFDVGSFVVGGKLTVTAVAADGTESLPVRANFDIISTPPGLQADWLGVVLGSDSLKYDTLKISFKVLDANPGTVPDNIPWFGGEDIGFISTAEGYAEVGGDGSASMSLSTRLGSQIDMGGFKLTPGIKGRPEWHYSSTLGQWQIGGSVGVELKAAYSTPPYYLPIAVPVFIRADVNVDNALLLSFRGWNPDNTPQFSGEWEFKGQLKGVLGCGASRFLAAEGYLGGGPVWTIEYQPEPTWKKLGIELNGGVRVVALFWVYDNQLLHYGWWKYGGPTEKSQAFMIQSFADQLNKPDASQFKMMSREYLKKSSPIGGAMVPQKVLALGAGGVGIMSATIDVLQANVYPYSEPALSVCGSNRVMVWIADDPARSDENRTELICSKWTEAGWANSTSVWNDGTADFSPVLAIFPDGKSLVAWQNERSSLTNGATLDEALAGLEIAVAKYDPATDAWSSTNLTDNLCIDRSPELAAATNGTALLTWISNPSNDVNGTVTNLNTVASRRWTGTEWVDAGNITTNARMLLWSTVAWNGSKGVFLAAIDGDDDQATGEDQELYGATFDESAWSPFARLTTNAVQDTRPQATFDSAGNLLVAWYQGSNIVMHTGDLDLSSPSIVGIVGGASSTKDFRVVTGPAGQISMVWADVAADGTGPDPFILNYDPTLHLWSQPIRLLSNTNLLERSFAGAYATNGALLLAYNQVHVQTDTNGIPVFTNNIVDLMFMDYLIGGDLGLSGADISLSTNNPQPGQTVNVSAAVRNLGELAATNIAVVFFNGNPASGGLQIGSTQIVAQLTAGASTNMTVAWTLPATVSNQTVYVVVDPDLAQEDRNRANNTASMTAVLPDLQVSEMSVLDSTSSKRMINVRVLNKGGVSSSLGFDVAFRRGATNGTLIGTTTIAALPVGGQFDANIEWDLGGSTFTTAYETVYAVADANNTVTESGKDNNVGMVQVMTSLDSDNDGLLDGEELKYGSNPQVKDSDGDGLSDGDEVHLYGTSPVLADSDGDGMKDGDEVRAGTDPNSKADVFAITGVDAMTGLTLVHWSAKSNKTYQVVRSWELLAWTNAPSADGTNQQSQQTAATNGVLQYLDPQSGTNSPIFYRVNIVE